MAEENKALVRRFMDEFWNQQNMATADELIAEDFVNHDPHFPGEPPGRDGIKQTVAQFPVSFPDGHFGTDDLIAEGDKVVMRGTFRGTHRGEFLGAPPSGNKVTVPYIVILRLQGGRITERWQQLDTLSLMQQLGAIPAPEQSG